LGTFEAPHPATAASSLLKEELTSSWTVPGLHIDLCPRETAANFITQKLSTKISMLDIENGQNCGQNRTSFATNIVMMPASAVCQPFISGTWRGTQQKQLGVAVPWAWHLAVSVASMVCPKKAGPPLNSH